MFLTICFLSFELKKLFINDIIKTTYKARLKRGIIKVKYIDISILFDSIHTYINEDLLEQYGESGSKNNIVRYIYNVSPDKIRVDNEKMYVSDELICADFVYRYLKKTAYDYSAKDIANLALKRIGIPPEEEMSLGSLEKTAKEIIDSKFKKNVYFKRSKSKDTICVDQKTAETISFHPDFLSKMHKQVQKAESSHIETPEWIKYKEEKRWIEFVTESFSNDETMYLSQQEESYIMIKAIFETFFTRFDIEKFNSLYNEWAHLEEIQDFSQRYQTLKDIFISPNYKNEFYHFDPSDDVLDLFAEKVASKIMKKLEKGS